ncbi:hypothetical protein SEA_OTTAWA_7 [Arthrobacter phage Ottawa]|nr:hypothetical protein SEA_KHARCHO_7 [Arthrobacter phage Kharcho]WIC89239.1 hypothetical protein SEA_OTTAWA_7 [Arthrobacter phage Ottawa]
MTTEYAIQSVDVHGNWSTEAKRYTSLQELANDYRARADAMTSGKAPTEVFRPLARLAAGPWVELEGDHYQNLNALTNDVHAKVPNRHSHMIMGIEAYEELLSAAMAFQYQLHPVAATNPKPTKVCTVTNTPDHHKGLLGAAEAVVNAHIREARAQGLLVDRLQTEYPEHNPHQHNPRPYSGPYTRDRIV